MRTALFLGSLFAAAWSSACTLVVVGDALHQPAPCAQPGDCAAGFSCRAGACTPVPDADAPPLPGAHVGTEGGDVLGPGITLHFEPGAVENDLQIEVDTASATNVAVGVDPVSGFFEVSPQAKLAGTVVVTIAADGCTADCHVFARPADPSQPWTKLDGDASGDGKAVGELAAGAELSGVYVAGTQP